MLYEYKICSQPRAYRKTNQYCPDPFLPGAEKREDFPIAVAFMIYLTCNFFTQHNM